MDESANEHYCFIADYHLDAERPYLSLDIIALSKRVSAVEVANVHKKIGKDRQTSVSHSMNIAKLDNATKSTTAVLEVVLVAPLCNDSVVNTRLKARSELL